MGLYLRSDPAAPAQQSGSWPFFKRRNTSYLTSSSHGSDPPAVGAVFHVKQHQAFYALDRVDTQLPALELGPRH